MALTNNLKGIITRQKETLSNLENEFIKIESNDLTLENNKLNTQLIKIKAESVSDYLKGVMLFGFGAVMLVIGELLNRKKPNPFSLGITAGGVAVLYGALVASYLGLEILGIYPALLICILITGVAFLLSTRYNVQVILTFALAGAYIPLFSLGGSDYLIYPAMIYFIILNLLSFTISFNKKWYVSTFRPVLEYHRNFLYHIKQHIFW